MRPLARVLVSGVLLVSLLLARGAAQDDPKKPNGEPTMAQQMAQGMVELLKQELDLRDDQVAKVTNVLQKGMDHLFANIAARENGEDPDDDLVKDEILDGLKGVLDPGQTKELDVLVREFDTQSGRFELGPPDDFDADGEYDMGAPGPADNKKALAKIDLWFEPELPSPERMALKAENVLLLSEAEKAVVLPRVQAVVLARRDLREVRHEQRRSLGHALHSGAREDEIKERVHDFRRRTLELEGKLAKAEDALREVLTLEQEARLVAIGLLD